jgi:hypothetical protein
LYEAPSDGTGGAHFVDVPLRVVVQQAAGTVIAFRHSRLHGTTLACGWSNSTISFAFTKRVAEAVTANPGIITAMLEGKVIRTPGEGAGEDNPNTLSGIEDGVEVKAE